MFCEQKNWTQAYHQLWMQLELRRVETAQNTKTHSKNESHLSPVGKLGGRKLLLLHLSLATKLFHLLKIWNETSQVVKMFRPCANVRSLWTSPASKFQFQVCWFSCTPKTCAPPLPVHCFSLFSCMTLWWKGEQPIPPSLLGFHLPQAYL